MKLLELLFFLGGLIAICISPESDIKQDDAPLEEENVFDDDID